MSGQNQDTISNFKLLKLFGVLGSVYFNHLFNINVSVLININILMAIIYETFFVGFHSRYIYNMIESVILIFSIDYFDPNGYYILLWMLLYFDWNVDFAKFVSGFNIAVAHNLVPFLVAIPVENKLYTWAIARAISIATVELIYFFNKIDLYKWAYENKKYFEKEDSYKKNDECHRNNEESYENEKPFENADDLKNQ
jgi:hypothetical protein